MKTSRDAQGARGRGGEPIRCVLLGAAVATGLLLLGGAACSESAQFITLASTTSTENSGLLDHLVPLFRESSGIEVRVVAVGTGQALRLGRSGGADALLVHDRASEERFVAEGHGVARVPVMANDFVIVGPSDDPAGMRGLRDAAMALTRVAAAELPFLSRADDSGTHKAELRLWAAAGLDPQPASGTWYRETGSGMGATLNTAAGMRAYTLADRGTWLSFANRRGLEILVEGDDRLLNPYGAIVVNPERHPHVKAEQAQRFVDWLVSSEGQAAIDAFRIHGEVLFRPAARGASAPGTTPAARPAAGAASGAK